MARAAKAARAAKTADAGVHSAILQRVDTQLFKKHVNSLAAEFRGLRRNLNEGRRCYSRYSQENSVMCSSGANGQRTVSPTYTTRQYRQQHFYSTVANSFNCGSNLQARGWPLSKVGSSVSCRETFCMSSSPSLLQRSSPFSSSSQESTFVSSHFKVDDRSIASFLSRVGAVCKRTNTHYVLKDCPACHPHKNREDNRWKLYVSHMKDGAFFCHRCGTKGSWFDLKSLLTGKSQAELLQGRNPSKPSRRAVGKEQNTRQRTQEQLPLPDQQRAGQLPNKLQEDQTFEDVLLYLMDERGLSRETLQKYCVGASEYSFRDSEGMWAKHHCITFPWITPIGRYESASGETGVRWQITRLKIRALSHKHMQRLEPAGGGWGLFGWHTVPESAKSIVLTEGEFDAMAVHQATGVPAVSLPNGCRSLPVDVLPQLERFERIYLWMDHDVPGQEGAEKFARKLGPNRCLIVRQASPSQMQDVLVEGKQDKDEIADNVEERVPQRSLEPPKDANEAMLAGLNLRSLIEGAQPLPHKEILTFSELRHELLHHLNNPAQALGTQFSTLPSLNLLLKGHRRGELTVLTGPTGAGKTTFLSQVSLDLCAQGVNTLWGSFEIKNMQLMKKMIQQYSGKASSGEVFRDHEHFNRVADEFAELPLYFMRFYGSTEIDEVLDAMEYATYVYDVEHIILDNLQFMLSSQMLRKSGFERFDAQEQALDKFRKFGKYGVQSRYEQMVD